MLDAGMNDNRLALSYFYNLGVRHPIRREDDDLVARIKHGHAHIGDTLLGAVGHHDLVGEELQPVVALEFGANSFAQFQQTGYWSVFGISIVEGFFGGLFDVVGRVEIGFAEAQVYHLMAFGFEFAGHGSHT